MTNREKAKLAHLKRYIGLPCIHGHSGERYVRCNTCCECSRVRVIGQRAQRRHIKPALRGAAASSAASMKRVPELRDFMGEIVEGSTVNWSIEIPPGLPHTWERNRDR